MIIAQKNIFERLLEEGLKNQGIWSIPNAFGKRNFETAAY